MPTFRRNPCPVIRQQATPRSTAERAERALTELLVRVSQGEEFPDACASLAMRFRVDYDALRKAYDAECHANARN